MPREKNKFPNSMVLYRNGNLIFQIFRVTFICFAREDGSQDQEEQMVIDSSRQDPQNEYYETFFLI